MQQVTLQSPLTSAQVAAASQLHSRLLSWKLIDAALDELQRRMPEFDEPACLIKSAAINQRLGFAPNRHTRR
jgi:hypothetical protein